MAENINQYENVKNVIYNCKILIVINKVPIFEVFYYF